MHYAVPDVVLQQEAHIYLLYGRIENCMENCMVQKFLIVLPG